MAQARIFRYYQSAVSYYRFGSGPEVLVAFHGFDQSGHHFFYFEEALSKQFTVIAIDFFWHGQSEWKEDKDFTEEDMKNIVSGIAKAEQLYPEKFSVCSFSMGSRMARALVRTFPHRIHRLILMSPPTFAFSRFLNFTTNTAFGLFMFRYFVRRNDVLLKCVKWLNKLKILNRAVYLFTSKFISRKDRMEKVYKTWYAQRKLRTDFDTFARLIHEHGILLVLLAGKGDKITPPHKMIRYVRKIKNAKVHLIARKHELTNEETRRFFEEHVVSSGESGGNT